MVDTDLFNIWQNLILERVMTKKTDEKVEKTTYEKKIEQQVQQQNNRFAGDLLVLSSYDKGLAEAIKNHSAYLLKIDLHTLFDLLPRSKRSKDRYDSLGKYLSTINVRLVITSGKEA